MSGLIGWLIGWAVITGVLAFIGGMALEERGSRSYAMLCAVALVWPMALVAAVVTFAFVVVGYGLYGFYLWGRLAYLEAANYLRRKGTSE